MQRIINKPDMVVEDMLKGFVKAHDDIVSATSIPGFSSSGRTYKRQGGCCNRRRVGT